MKKIALLGSTGSIGTQTLQVIDAHKERFGVSVLAAHSNVDLIEQQALQYHPDLVVLYEEWAAEKLQKRQPSLNVMSGEEGLVQAVQREEVDFVMLAMTGTKGLRPTMAAIRAKKTLGLANKEVMVAAGQWIMQLAKEHNVSVLPVDSEHSAIFQCLQGEVSSVDHVVLTASGGPFFRYTEKELQTISYKDALQHPTWTMGNKVSVDCSNLMNKGFEVIEARYLFDLPPEKIRVVIHPQSLVHSFVCFCDGSFKAQISPPDMKLPIQYALSYPERLIREKNVDNLFEKYPLWEFHPADKFICLQLCYHALSEGGTSGAFLHAANEVLVERFSRNELHWLEIGQKLADLMGRYSKKSLTHIEDVFTAEQEGKEMACHI